MYLNIYFKNKIPKYNVDHFNCIAAPKGLNVDRKFIPAMYKDASCPLLSQQKHIFKHSWLDVTVRYTKQIYSSPS